MYMKFNLSIQTKHVGGTQILKRQATKPAGEQIEEDTPRLVNRDPYNGLL